MVEITDGCNFRHEEIHGVTLCGLIQLYLKVQFQFYVQIGCYFSHFGHQVIVGIWEHVTLLNKEICKV